MARPRGHGPRADGHIRPALHLGRDAVGMGEGFRPPDRARVQRRRDRLRHQAQHPAAARRRRLQDHGGARDHLGRRHPGDEAGRRVPVERPRRSRGNRQICRAGDPEGDRVRYADIRHLPRSPDAGPCSRRQDHEDASGPSRRQSSGQGRDHRQGRDHLDEPRLCGGPGDPAQGCDADPHLAVRRLQLRHPARRQAGILRAVSPRGLARAARLALSVQAVCGFDAGEEGRRIGLRVPDAAQRAALAAWCAADPGPIDRGTVAGSRHCGASLRDRTAIRNTMLDAMRAI